MTINILTLFPQFFESPLKVSILGKAAQQKKVDFKLVNIRDFAQDKHQVTDLPPYGGGPGMVMKVEPIDRALASLKVKKGQPQQQIILTSAKGQLWQQQQAQQFSNLEQLTIICGHYEGVDERVAQHLVDQEIRIGDFVLTGGEPAALVIADSVARLISGVLGNEQSLVDESHTQPGQLAAPVYTRPENYQGWQVPTVLLSGNHQQIQAWRENQTKMTQD